MPQQTKIESPSASASASGKKKIEKNRICAESLPKWNLSDLYQGGVKSVDLERDIERVYSQSREFEARLKGKIKEAALARNLGKSIREYEKLQELMDRISSFAELLYNSDTLKQENILLRTNVQEKIIQADLQTLFFPLELNELTNEMIEESLKEDPILLFYKPWIENLRQEKPHQIETKLEELLHEKSITSRNAWERLFDDTIANMKFKIEEEELHIEPALDKLREKDPKTRENAAGVLAKTFKENLRIFTLITNTLAKDLDIENRWRSFSHPADFRHLSNRVEAQVIEALTEAVNTAIPWTSEKYYRMKARWLNLPQLNHWDRNAPLPEDCEKEIPWKEAENIVIQAYEQFCPEMANIGKQFFQKNWIDAGVQNGKAPGAFACSTVPCVHPYIFLNYMGKPEDVMTLAHELGHGIHQILANKQGFLMSKTPLTLSETASTFGEILTFRSLLDQISDKKNRKIMLARKIESMLNTITRQTAFYQFELSIHLERRKGELTSEKIGEIWLETQKNSLGDGINLREDYKTFWTFIPHFIHSPFYVYSYAFGHCLANCLYSTYIQSKADFANKYMKILEGGGAKHYRELLSPLGLDPSDPGFWLKGLSLIGEMINELEALEGEALN